MATLNHFIEAGIPLGEPGDSATGFAARYRLPAGGGERDLPPPSFAPSGDGKSLGDIAGVDLSVTDEEASSRTRLAATCVLMRDQERSILEQNAQQLRRTIRIIESMGSPLPQDPVAAAEIAGQFAQALNDLISIVHQLRDPVSAAFLITRLAHTTAWAEEAVLLARIGASGPLQEVRCQPAKVRAAAASCHAFLADLHQIPCGKLAVNSPALSIAHLRCASLLGCTKSLIRLAVIIEFMGRKKDRVEQAAKLYVLVASRGVDPVYERALVLLEHFPKLRAFGMRGLAAAARANSLPAWLLAERIFREGLFGTKRDLARSLAIRACADGDYLFDEELITHEDVPEGYLIFERTMLSVFAEYEEPGWADGNYAIAFSTVDEANDTIASSIE